MGVIGGRFEAPYLNSLLNSRKASESARPRSWKTTVSVAVIVAPA